MKTFYLLLKGLILSFLFFLIFSACTSNSIKSDYIRNPKYREAIVESHQKVIDFMYTSFIPGVSVSVSHNGETIWSEGIGKASVELNVPVNRKTKFRIGNTTEMFTTYLIAILQQEGKVNVDSSFYHYIPEYPKKQFDFNLRMLGAHTAGFNENKIDNIVRISDIKNLKDYVTYFENKDQIYKPDTYFLRDDYSTALLGILSEDVTGKAYRNLLTEMITDTLHLTSTVLDVPQFTIDNRSEFYTVDFIARLMNAPETNLLPFAPVHGLLSTADDLNIAAQQILSPGFFNSESIDLLTQNHSYLNGKTINRSFGWWVSKDEKKRKILAQIGSTIGGASVIIVCPEEGLVVSMASNKGDDISELPSYAIAEIFLKYIDNAK